MSDYDVSPSEMRRLSNISDSDLDVMRAGDVPHGDSSLEGVAQFVRDLSEAFPEPSTAEFENAHVAAMMGVAHLMADNGEPAAKPVSKAHGPGTQASGLPKPWRGTTMMKIKSVFATRAAKVTAATAAMLLAFSGVAIAGGMGELPDPVQDAVANGVAPLGVDLPGGDDEAAEAAEAAEEAAAEAAEEAAEAAEEAAEQAAEAAEEAADIEEDAAVDEAEDADDEGEDADDQGEDADEEADDDDERSSASVRESDDNDDDESSSARESDDDDDDEADHESEDDQEDADEGDDGESDGGEED